MVNNVTYVKLVIDCISRDVPDTIFSVQVFWGDKL